MTTAIRAAATAIKALAALAALTALLAGLPYALIRFVGWPLPRTMPTWNGIQQALTHQITGPTLYIDTLACLLWACWAVLALSFLVELGYALARIPAPHVPGLGPGQILAAALIAALGLSISARPASAATPRLSAHLTGPTAATAPLQPATGSAFTAVAASGTHAATEAVHTVVPGDSLWTIAQEDLGNGKDWPRLYQLNADKTQPGGGTLTDPDLIKPGWTLRITPDTPAAEPTSPSASASSAAGVQSHPGAPAAAPSSPQGTATTAQPQLPASSATPRPAAADHTRDTASPARARRTSPVSLTLPEGGLVGVSLSAALATAVLAWRRQRRRTANPYWNARHIPHEPHLPAAVGAIHQAHLTLTTATHADDEDEDDLDAFGAPTAPDRPPAAHPPPHHGPDPAPAPASGWARPQPPGVIAVARDGAREALLEAAGGGFGLAGAHAVPAARAILAAILAAHDPGAPEARPRLIIPAHDLDLLLAPHTTTPADHQISALSVTSDLDSALAACEAELLHRTRLLEHSAAEDLDHLAAEHPDLEDPAPLYLLATRSHPAAKRVTALCENGARLRIAVILLAGHPSRPTLTPGPDGALTHPQSLLPAGSQLFHLPANALREILTTLAGAETTLPDEPPPAPPEHLDPDDDELREDHDPHRDQGAVDTPARQAPPTLAIAPSPDAQPRGKEPGPEPSDGRDRAEQDPASSSPASPGTKLTTPAAGHEAAPTAPATPAPGPARSGTGPGAAGSEPHPVQVWEHGLVRVQLTGPLRLLARGPGGWSEITRGLRSDAWPVLALLALHRRDPITAQDAEQIWPDLPPEQVRRKLTDALKSLRTTLRRETGAGSAEFFPPGQGRYRLDPRLVSADTWCLDTSAADASRRTEPEAKREGFETALTHYHGDLASDRAGDAFAFLDEWREPTRRRALSTAAAAGQLAEQHGDLEAALAHFETALAIDPLIEETARHIMTLQHRLDRPTDIRATARALEHRLQTTLGVLPAPATRTLVSQLLGDHPPPPPPAPRPAPSRTAPTTTPPTRPAVGSTHRRAS